MVRKPAREKAATGGTAITEHVVPVQPHANVDHLLDVWRGSRPVAINLRVPPAQIVSEHRNNMRTRCVHIRPSGRGGYCGRGWYPPSALPALCEWLRESKDPGEAALAEAILKPPEAEKISEKEKEPADTSKEGDEKGEKGQGLVTEKEKEKGAQGGPPPVSQQLLRGGGTSTDGYVGLDRPLMRGVDASGPRALVALRVALPKRKAGARANRRFKLDAPRVGSGRGAKGEGRGRGEGGGAERRGAAERRRPPGRADVEGAAARVARGAEGRGDAPAGGRTRQAVYLSGQLCQ